MGAYTSSTITPVAALAVADVWSAVRCLSDAASSLPLHVYRRAGDGRERVTSGFLVDLLAAPSPGVTEADFVSTLMSHVLIWGNAYIGKYRQGGTITELGLLDPERCRPELQSGQLRYRYSPGNGPQRLLTTADVIHVRGLSVDSLNGLSAVSQASRVIGLSDQLVRHALQFFSAGARPSGVLKVSPTADAETFQAWLEQWRADNTGQAGAHRVAVLSGDADFVPFSEPLDNLQFSQQRELAAREIARCFRIPPHMLGASTGDSLTYSTVEQQSLDFVRYSLQPWLRRIELALSSDNDLTSLRQYVRFEVDALLRPDSAGRATFYEKALASGWLDINEVRQLEDLPPRPASPSVEQMLTAASSPLAEAVPTNGGGSNA